MANFVFLLGSRENKRVCVTIQTGGGGGVAKILWCGAGPAGKGLKMQLVSKKTGRGASLVGVGFPRVSANKVKAK